MAFNLCGNDPGGFFISGLPSFGGRSNHNLTIHVLAQDVKIVKPVPLPTVKPPLRKPTPIEIVIQESITVGSPSGGAAEETSTEGILAPSSEAIAVQAKTVVEPGAAPTPASQDSVETKKYK